MKTRADKNRELIRPDMDEVLRCAATMLAAAEKEKFHNPVIAGAVQVIARWFREAGYQALLSSNGGKK